MGSSAEKLEIPEGYVPVFGAYVEDTQVLVNGKSYHIDGRYTIILIPEADIDNLVKFSRPINS